MKMMTKISRGIETDDQLSPEVNEELHDFYEGSTAKETDDQPSSEDGDKNNDGYQSQEPEVIKLLFKGSFSENSGEIIANINKLNKICFGNDKMNGCEDFSSPENQSCENNSTLEMPVEYQNLIDSDDGLNVKKTKESEFGGNILGKEVEDAQEIVNNGIQSLKPDVVTRPPDCLVLSDSHSLLGWDDHVYLLPLLAMAVVCMFTDTKYTEFMEEVAKAKVAKMKMVKNCKNSRCASHYLFTADERLDIQLGHHEETEKYEVYEELLDESVVETVTNEAVLYDEMSGFPTSLVLLLYLSYPDVAQNELPAVANLLPGEALYELPAVENLLPDVALDERPVVEDLSASVDTTGSAMPYYLVRPVIRQRYQLLVDRGKIIR